MTSKLYKRTNTVCYLVFKLWLIFKPCLRIFKTKQQPNSSKEEPNSIPANEKNANEQLFIEYCNSMNLQKHERTIKS